MGRKSQIYEFLDLFRQTGLAMKKDIIIKKTGFIKSKVDRYCRILRKAKMIGYQYKYWGIITREDES